MHGAWCMVHRASCIVSTGGTQNSRSLLFPKIATSSLVGIHVNWQTSYGLCFPHHVSSSHPPSRASTIHEPPSKWPFSHANMRDVLPRSGVSFRSTRLSCLTNSRTVSAWPYALAELSAISPMTTRGWDPYLRRWGIGNEPCRDYPVWPSDIFLNSFADSFSSGVMFSIAWRFESMNKDNLIRRLWSNVIASKRFCHRWIDVRMYERKRLHRVQVCSINASVKIFVLRGLNPKLQSFL